MYLFSHVIVANFTSFLTNAILMVLLMTWQTHAVFSNVMPTMWHKHTTSIVSSVKWSPSCVSVWVHLLPVCLVWVNPSCVSCVSSRPSCVSCVSDLLHVCLMWVTFTCVSMKPSFTCVLCEWPPSHVSGVSDLLHMCLVWVTSFTCVLFEWPPSCVSCVIGFLHLWPCLLQMFQTQLQELTTGSHNQIQQAGAQLESSAQQGSQDLQSHIGALYEALAALGQTQDKISEDVHKYFTDDLMADVPTGKYKSQVCWPPGWSWKLSCATGISPSCHWQASICPHNIQMMHLSGSDSVTAFVGVTFRSCICRGHMQTLHLVGSHSVNAFGGSDSNIGLWEVSCKY